MGKMYILNFQCFLLLFSDAWWRKCAFKAFDFPFPIFSDTFWYFDFSVAAIFRYFSISDIFRLHYFLIFFRFAIFRYSGCVRRWNTASSSFCSMKRRLLSYWKCISVFIRATAFNIVLQNNEISAQSQWIYSAKSFLCGWAVVGNKVWINCNIDAL